MKKQELKENEEKLRKLWDFKLSNTRIIGMAGEEEEQEIENLLEKNNERKLPQPGKGNTHTSPGSSESQKKMDPKRNTLRHLIIKSSKIKDKERP